MSDEVTSKLQALLQWRSEAATAASDEGVDATDTLISQLLQRAHPTQECLQGILTLLMPSLTANDADQHVFALACLRLLTHANARLLSHTDLCSHLLPLLGSDDRDVQRGACDVLERLLAEFEAPPPALEALYNGLMEARQAACERLAVPNTPDAAQQTSAASEPVTVRRRSAAIACRRYASVLLYQLLHSGGPVGVCFLQHAALLVDHGDVADQLFVVQRGHAELARHCFEVLLQHADAVVADPALLDHVIGLLSTAAEQPAVQGYSLHIVTHYLVTREAAGPSAVHAAPLPAAFVRLVQEKVGEVLVSLLNQQDQEAADAAASTLHWVVASVTGHKGDATGNSSWAHTVLARFVHLGGLETLQAPPSSRAPHKGARHGSLAAPVALQVLATGHPPTGSFVFVHPSLFDESAAIAAVQAYLRGRNKCSDEEPSAPPPRPGVLPRGTSARGSLTMESVEAVRRAVSSLFAPAEGAAAKPL